MYKLYSRLSDRKAVLEVFGASTKHPDKTFSFSQSDLSDWLVANLSTTGLVLKCEGKLNLPFPPFLFFDKMGM